MKANELRIGNFVESECAKNGYERNERHNAKLIAESKAKNLHIPCYSQCFIQQIINF